MIDFTGKLKDIRIDYRSRLPIISFEINEEPNGLDELQELKLKIKVGKLTRKRSLDSNAYFHLLVDKMRLKKNISFAAMKNELITSYGQILYLDDENKHAAVIKSNVAPETFAENEAIHLKFLKPSDDGAYWYRIYRGSHTYDTAEMSTLIEGTVLDAKDYGIETATPQELARMAKLWEDKNAKG